jgi:hypothetical protein
MEVAADDQRGWGVSVVELREPADPEAKGRTHFSVPDHEARSMQHLPSEFGCHRSFAACLMTLGDRDATNGQSQCMPAEWSLDLPFVRRQERRSGLAQACFTAVALQLRWQGGVPRRSRQPHRL